MAHSRKYNSAIPDITGNATLPSPRAKWAFRLAALLLAPLMAFACLEGGLRLLGWGYDTHFFLASKINDQKVFVENEKFGWPFFGQALARVPRPMIVSARKPADTCRIFVFGESAAYGDPEPDFGLPRVLQTLLSEHDPSTHFEVINASMVAINSNIILPIAQDCARQNGDIWVIYMGNNEVVGPYGSGTVFGPQAPPLPLIRGSIAVKRTRLGQLLAGLLGGRSNPQKEQAEWGGMTMFLDQQVRHDEARMERVYSNFSRNLKDIIKVGRDHGSRIIVSTVASNLKNCGPFGSQHKHGLTEDRKAEWERIYHAAAEAEANGKKTEALELYQKAEQLDDQFADLQFRLGRLCLELGRAEAARHHLLLARDYDTLRFRADSRINDLICKTAIDREKEGVYFVDAAEKLAIQSPDALIGNELFYEHVHLNFDGNYWLARCLADEVAKTLPETVKAPANASWLSLSDCANRMAWTDWNRSETAKAVLLRLSDMPFTGESDHAEQCHRLQAQIEQLMPAMSRARLGDAVEVYRRALVASPEDWVLHNHLGQLHQKRGDFSAAIEPWRKAAKLLPHNCEMHIRLGSLLNQQKRFSEATSEFEAALRLKPQLPEAIIGLGAVLSRENKYGEAVLQFEKAIKLKPNSSDARLKLGLALKALGKTNESKEQFRLALERKPRTPDGLITLGKVCMGQGWLDEAITNFSSAVTLDPTDAMAQFCLGGALGTKGLKTEALKCFTLAVQLNPDLAEAHLGLGIELGRQGRHAQATEQFSEAVRLNPDLIEAHYNLGVALFKQKKTEDAIREFREVLRIDPKNMLAPQYLDKLGQKA